MQLKQKIIMHLAYVNTTQPKILSATFDNEYSYVFVRRCYNQLLENELIEEYTYQRIRYCKLSAKGITEARLLSDKTGECPYPSKFYKRDSKATSQKATLFTLLKICGIRVYYNELPTKDNGLNEIQLDDVAMMTEDQRDSYLLRGIYYSAKDILGILDKSELGENFACARITGIIIKNKTIFLLYFVGNRLITFNKVMVEKTQDAIIKHFNKHENIFKGVNIFIGNNDILLPAIISGHKHGENNTAKNNPLHDKGGFNNQLNAKTISRSFPAYYVPLNKKKIETLLELFQLGSCPHRVIENAFIDTIRQCDNVSTRSIQHSSIQFSIKDEEADRYIPSIYLPYYDIHETKDLRLLNKVNVFTTDEKADAISKSLGTHLHKIYRLYKNPNISRENSSLYLTKFNRIPVQKYDDDGFAENISDNSKI